PRPLEAALRLGHACRQCWRRRAEGRLMAVDERMQQSLARAADSSGTPDIRLDRITKSFGDIIAVDDLSLEIPRASFFALLGASGCCKTTTLRMIGGIEDPTAGLIYLGRRVVGGTAASKRDVDTAL